MKPAQCNDRRLLQILDDTSADRHLDTVAHLEDCERCQSRLVELAADGDSWTVARDALRDSDVYQNRSDDQNLEDVVTRSLSGYPDNGSVIIAVDSELAEDIPVQADRVSLDFLSPASHPEMLGRVGQYDVERLIGTGGMGIVFKAFDSELHRPVAVKVLAPHLAHSGGARQRFAREAQSAAAVVHENVVPIHYVDTKGDLPFLVMQYVAGESLQARIDREGPLGADEILQIGIQIARGLSAAHDQGLVHRDVKPGNILLESAINRVLITDFGLARAADDASVTRSGIIAGTPHYMSPEQAKGLPVDTRSDLFGLGGVLYFMATGRPPFRADGAIAVLNKICSTEHRPVDEVNEQIPADLAELTDDLLAKDPAERPASAEAIADALSGQLKSFRSGRPRFRKRRKSMKWRLGILACATLVLASAVGVWLLPPSIFPFANGSPRNVQPMTAGPPAAHSDGIAAGPIQFAPLTNANVRANAASNFTPAKRPEPTVAPPIEAPSWNQTPADLPFAPPPEFVSDVVSDPMDWEIRRQIKHLEVEIINFEEKWMLLPPVSTIPPETDPLSSDIDELKMQIEILEQGPSQTPVY